MIEVKKITGTEVKQHTKYHLVPASYNLIPVRREFATPDAELIVLQIVVSIPSRSGILERDGNLLRGCVKRGRHMYGA